MFCKLINDIINIHYKRKRTCPEKERRKRNVIKKEEDNNITEERKDY